MTTPPMQTDVSDPSATEPDALGSNRISMGETPTPTTRNRPVLDSARAPISQNSAGVGTPPADAEGEALGPPDGGDDSDAAGEPEPDGVSPDVAAGEPPGSEPEGVDDPQPATTTSARMPTTRRRDGRKWRWSTGQWYGRGPERRPDRRG